MNDEGFKASIYITADPDVEPEMAGVYDTQETFFDGCAEALLAVTRLWQQGSPWIGVSIVRNVEAVEAANG